jgi:hypothetical protein
MVLQNDNPQNCIIPCVSFPMAAIDDMARDKIMQCSDLICYDCITTGIPIFNECVW